MVGHRRDQEPHDRPNMTKPELNDGNKEEPETKLLLSAQLGSREDFSRLYEMHADRKSVV